MQKEVSKNRSRESNGLAQLEKNKCRIWCRVVCHRPQLSEKPFRRVTESDGSAHRTGTGANVKVGILSGQ